MLNNIVILALDSIDVSTVPQVDGTSSTAIKAVLQLIFAALGSTAVVFVIIGGLKMITSNGDPQALAKTRNTIIYALVGLTVAISAELIVTFVLKNL
ncbi:hypothetical protein KDA11_06980 [Candidatus Saccharibacteria bacterium]|nr:hypothetical protein [Candidatus Saccharibacteria bacterium]